jgi:hypothetical protein
MKPINALFYVQNTELLVVKADGADTYNFLFFYGASPTFFLHSSSSPAAAFQFRIRCRLAASLCMASSHLFNGLPTGLSSPKQLRINLLHITTTKF